MQGHPSSELSEGRTPAEERQFHSAISLSSWVEDFKVFLSIPCHSTGEREDSVCILAQNTMVIYDYNSYSQFHVLLPILSCLQRFQEVPSSVNWEAIPGSGLQGRASSGNRRDHSGLARVIRRLTLIAYVREDTTPLSQRAPPRRRTPGALTIDGVPHPAHAGARPPSVGVPTTSAEAGRAPVSSGSPSHGGKPGHGVQNPDPRGRTEYSSRDQGGSQPNRLLK